MKLQQDYYRTKEKAGCIVGQSAIYLYICDSMKYFI